MSLHLYYITTFGSFMNGFCNIEYVFIFYEIKTYYYYYYYYFTRTLFRLLRGLSGVPSGLGTGAGRGWLLKGQTV